MKCDTCGEEFENKYSYCPIDGNSLRRPKTPSSCDYRPTLIDDQLLTARLLREVRFAAKQFRKAWPRFKAEPLAFTRIQLLSFGRATGQLINRPYALQGLLIATAALIAVTLSVLLLDEKPRTNELTEAGEETGLVVSIDLRTDPTTDSKPGVGVGDNGRVGFSRGRGEGSGATPKQSQGGGSGGNLSKLPPSQGRPPHPSEIPAPIPTTYAKLPPQALPAAGIDIDPVLYRPLPFPNYGDPRSNATTPSNGPGTGGGIGTNRGLGIGDGDGNGVDRGRKGNIGGGEKGAGCCGSGGSDGNNPAADFDRVFRGPELTTRARVLSKPEPQYTEEARKKGITGTVILSVVFSREGQVINVRASQSLCCGLTERAMAAAKQIRFLPATRDGHAVSTYMQLEYNFYLY